MNIELDTDYQSYIEISCEGGTYFLNNFDNILYINHDIRRKFDNSKFVVLYIVYSINENNLYMQFPIEDIEYANECFRAIKKILFFKEKNKNVE